MTKNEFLEKLKAALANDLTGPIVRENVEYYSEYISSEAGSGRSEAEVIEELGDPWALARTIIDTATVSGGQSDIYGQEENMYGPGTDDVELKRAGIGIFRRLVVILGIVGILLVIVAVIGGIISFVAPVLVPLLVILFVIRTINRRQ